MAEGGKRPADRARAPDDRDSANRRNRSTPDRIEWIVGSLSALIVVAMIGFILYEAVGETASKPELHVVVGAVEPAGDGFRVEFRAVNRGGKTAAEVKIEGRLERSGQAVETSDVVLDYVPSRSEREGGLIFRNDPRQYHLHIAAKAYRKP